MSSLLPLREAGATLIETLIALSLMMMVIGGVVALVMYLTESSDRIMNTAAESEIITNVRQDIMNTSNLLSWSEKVPNNVTNADFLNCLTLTGTPCLNATLYPITIPDASGMAVTGPAAIPGVSTANPMCYNQQGNACPVAANCNCVYDVTTEFLMQMPWSTSNNGPFPQYPNSPSPAGDKKPEVFQFIYNITPTGNAESVTARTVTGMVFIDTQDTDW